MYVFKVLYPTNGQFDLQYYINKHMAMVERLWKPFGMNGWSVTKVAEALEGDAPFQIITSVEFDDKAGYDRAMEATATEIMADIPNYTKLTPIILLGESAGRASYQTKKAA